ncbi:MAG: hypothetical protein BWY82_01233 [Verrucomicrobia bacterium ADurb.Bin474]|nr:MAG: hypothetical protein BWY82_01233 [Verrucomicrobia bacterium ADurb.Bin474]
MGINREFIVVGDLVRQPKRLATSTIKKTGRLPPWNNRKRGETPFRSQFVVDHPKGIRYQNISHHQTDHHCKISSNAPREHDKPCHYPLMKGRNPREQQNQNPHIRQHDITDQYNQKTDKQNQREHQIRDNPTRDPNPLIWETESIHHIQIHRKVEKEKTGPCNNQQEDQNRQR